MTMLNNNSHRRIGASGGLALALVLGLVACGDDSSNTPDAAVDGTVDATDAGGQDARITDAEVADASLILPDGGTDCESVVCDPSCAVYVDISRPVPGPGTTPELALTDVQTGVDNAAGLAGNCCSCEVRVAEGRYVIYEADPTDTLRLRERVQVLGGYPAGFSGTRDPVSHETILDGREENEGPGHVYHVVTGASYARLDGFTVTGGRARADANPFNPDNYGGGLVNLGTTPTVESCVFTDNEAVYGGGVYNSQSTTALLRCRFEGNSADVSGGGVHCLDSEVTVAWCVFRANHAADGGGLHLGPGSDAEISNTTFSGNTATGDGGGALSDLSAPVFLNTTFSRNSAAAGGAVHSRNGAHPVLTNSVLWDNAPDEVTRDASALVTATFCDVMGGCTVAGGCTTDDSSNLDVDPLFVDAGAGDLRLWVASPVIDQGDNSAATALATDLDGDARILDGDNDSQAVVDLGADESAVSLPLPIIYVDQAATGANDGSSWTDAYWDLQSALTTAPPYHQIYVATGTYVPSGLGDKSASFVMPPAVEVLGGFDPAQGITTEAQRDPTLYETILSGDLMGDDPLGQTSNNSFQVVKSGSMSFLDGFTVTAGRTDIMLGGPGQGAGLYIQSGHQMAVRNCRFTECRANGASAIYAEQDSLPVIERCDFVDNTAQGSAAAVGLSNVHPGSRVTDSTFDSNIGSYAGGAMYINSSQGVTVQGCDFSNNSVSSWNLGGGAVYISNSDDVRVVSSTFTGNSANLGGALQIEGSTGVSIEDSTFDGNSVVDYNIVQPCDKTWHFMEAVGGGVYTRQSDLRISGSTFTGNTAVYTGSGMCLGNLDRDEYEWFYGLGGGVFALESTLDLVDTTFTSNLAQITGNGCWAGGGGGVATWETPLRAVNVAFLSNTASGGPGWQSCGSGDGGGLWALRSPGDQLANCVFEGNGASIVAGGFLIHQGSMNMYGSTVTGNAGSATGEGGGGVLSQSGTLRIYNSILWGNSGFPPNRDLNVWLGCSSTRRLYTYNTNIDNNGSSGCVAGCTGCTNPYNANPQFTDAGTNPPDLRLQAGSPLLEQGSNSATDQAADWLDLDNDGDTAELIPYDMDGNPRRTNTMDLGAYERP